MFSYQFYKVVHIIGIVCVFSGIGAVLANSLMGGEKKFKGRKWAMIFHGVGLLITFVAGFGLMARLEMMGSGWPGWIYGKVAIWLFLGLIIAVIARAQKFALPLWLLVISAAGCAAYLANYKPF
ncbi:MAG: hypothetical protein AAF202_12205 [Pseudomonadota bacterium]